MPLMKRADTWELQAKLFRGLSDESRLAILECLRGGPLPVGQIAETTGLSQSNTSNHLRCLGDCGLVSAEQHGRHVHYRLNDNRVSALLHLADDLLAEVGRRIYACTNYAGSIKPAAAAAAKLTRRQKKR